jgi:hypothetical protein
MALMQAALCFGQPERSSEAPPSALASAERVEVRGTVERVLFVPGVGTPVLVLRAGEETVRVQLGSMRYLMEKDFNPRAGDAIVVRGFRVNHEILARTVELPAEKKTLELRSADGAPLWRMGRYGKKGR